MTWEIFESNFCANWCQRLCNFGLSRQYLDLPIAMGWNWDRDKSLWYPGRSIRYEWMTSTLEGYFALLLEHWLMESSICYPNKSSLFMNNLTHPGSKKHNSSDDLRGYWCAIIILLNNCLTRVILLWDRSRELSRKNATSKSLNPYCGFFFCSDCLLWICKPSI